MSDLPSPLAVFHSGRGTHRGPAQGDMARGLRARKREHEVHVRFATHACAVDTLEGVVQAQPGDAIVTGLFGEHWSVPRAAFVGKYRAVPPLEMGAPGQYMSLPIDVLAVPMEARFEVVLADGHSRLAGQAGDWLIDYGDGNLGIVNAAIFAATYQLSGSG